MAKQLDIDYDICRNKHGGNELSEDAHTSIKDSKRAAQLAILRYLRSCAHYGATASEMSDALGIRQASMSARCSELKAKKQVVDSGNRRKTDTGRYAAVLVLKEFANE